MPKLPESKHRPWMPKKPKFYREIDNASFYNSKRWRSVRKYFIKKNPICISCKRKNIDKAAKVVDHILPITMGGSQVDLKNLQSLCESCHNSKSAREGIEKRKSIKTYVRKPRK